MNAQKLVVILLSIFGGAFIFNLLILDYFFLWQKTPQKTPALSEERKELIQDNGQDNCGFTCERRIREATESAMRKVLDLINQLPTPVVQKITEKIIEKNPPTFNNSQKEIYVTIGSLGSTVSRDWVDVSGSEVNLDRSKYPANSVVTFEVSLKILSGNGTAFARLYNVTDKNPMIETELKSGSENFQRIESGSLNLPNTEKLYRVQLKSNTGYQVDLSLARFRIKIN